MILTDEGAQNFVDEVLNDYTGVETSLFQANYNIYTFLSDLQGFNSLAYNYVMTNAPTTNFDQKYTLNELDIYGSSRLVCSNPVICWLT